MINIESNRDLESTLRDHLSETWSVEAESARITVQASDLPVWARVEPREGGSFVVTGYLECIWNERTDVPLNVLYREIDTTRGALDYLTGFCHLHETNATTRPCIDGDAVSLQRVSTAVATTGAAFAAVAEDHLHRRRFDVQYHMPPGGDPTEVRRALAGNDILTIGEEVFLVRHQHVPYPEVHFHRRVPLYSEGEVWGLERVTPAEGRRQVCEFVTSDRNPSPPPTEPASAAQLVSALVESGATAIAVEEALSNEAMLTVRVWIAPSAGYDAVGAYKALAFAGREYDLDWEFNPIDGPHFFERVPLFAAEEAVGVDSVSIDQGLENLYGYLADGD